MMNISKIRKIGLWAIAFMALMGLLAMNIAEQTSQMATVAYGALATLLGWFIVTGIIELWQRRR